MALAACGSTVDVETDRVSGSSGPAGGGGASSSAGVGGIGAGPTQAGDAGVGGAPDSSVAMGGDVECLDRPLACHDGDSGDEALRSILETCNEQLCGECGGVHFDCGGCGEIEATFDADGCATTFATSSPMDPTYAACVVAHLEALRLACASNATARVYVSCTLPDPC
jgi:hypothetical protein